MIAPAEVVETHISIVFFVGDRAYKLKKSVRFDFLDFSTRERRREACHREVELNRRLAPDVYLGVADIVGPDGAPVDHLVVMRRMPPDRRLAALVSSDAPRLDDELRHLAHVIAAFHSTATTNDEITGAATPDALLRRWSTNLVELRAVAGEVLDVEAIERADALGRAWLAGRRPLLDRRCRDGRIRDGHGDLQAADVFLLDDGPRVLDCIEFDDRLRHADVIDDVAFLAMDLERLGHGDLAELFVRAYRDLAGDPAVPSLVDHYVAYRALVRAKVACLRSQQDALEASSVVEEARALLGIALAHLEAARVQIVAVGGLPGTGKTTLARGVAERLGATVLRSDEIRKELLGVPAHEPLAAGFGEGAYDDATTSATYASLVDRARALAERGESVVVDASWSDAATRAQLRAVAAEVAAELVELRCEVDPAVAAERIVRRRSEGADASDATPEVARLMGSRFDPWPEASVIDADQPLRRCVDRAEEAIRAAVPPT